MQRKQKSEPVVFKCGKCQRPFAYFEAFKKHEALCDEVGKLCKEKAEHKKRFRTTVSDNIDEKSAVESLPDLELRKVVRTWEPINGKAFTWSEMEVIGRQILTEGTTWLRMHYRMLPGNRVPANWARDTSTVFIEEGTIYERITKGQKGQLYVAYEDGDSLKHEHLDVTMDCCVIRLEELGVGVLEDTDSDDTRESS